MKLLIVNPGSTSLKFKLIEFAEAAASETPPRTLAHGKVERIGSERSPFAFVLGENGVGGTVAGDLEGVEYRGALRTILDTLQDPAFGPVLGSLDELGAVGFKAVHAGPLGRGPGATRLTDDVIRAMERYTVLAPAHNRAYLTCIRGFQAIAPGLVLAALFEPAFHVTIPEERSTYGLPLEWRETWGIQRYGFHGASHHYIARRMPQLLGLSETDAASLRLISCHLGGSSSLCAIQGGRSVDTTFGFSAQTGILHSTRCETIDPFVVLFAMQEMGMNAEEVSRVLCDESGLKGLSGTSGDLRDVLAAAASDDPEAARRARLALDVFYYQTRREIAAMTAAMRGVDAICFTGGIGERGEDAREAICEGLDWLGVELDPGINRETKSVERCLSTSASRVAVWTCPTNEELVVATEIRDLLRGARSERE